MPIISEEGLSVAVIGATGCLGKELVQQLAEKFLIKDLYLFASKRRVGDEIEVDGDFVSVLDLGEGIPAEIVQNLQVAFFVCPSHIVTKYAPGLAYEGVSVFDLTGTLGAQYGYHIAGLTEKLDDFVDSRICVLPSPTAIALAKVFFPLKELAVWNLQASIGLSASRFGNAGMDELGKQVRALLSMQDAPQKLFPEGLAFDVLPSIGAIEENGQSATEILLSQELANILDMQEIFFRCSLQVLPIFAGITITAQLAFGAEVSVQQITSLLSEDASMVVGDQVPTLRNVITSPKIYVGRIRSNPLLQGCDLTIHCDNVSVAVQNALDMLESFQKEDII